MKLVARIVVTSMVAASALFAQLRVSGQATAEFFKSESGFSQYTINQGRGTFAWRWDLFADAVVSDNVTLLSNFRMLQDQIPHIDLFAIRITDIASSGISLQAGQIDIPFGNLGERRFPQQNPFFGLPLINEHITALCSTDYKLWTLFPGFAVSGNGVRLFDQGLYDLGVKIYGSAGIFNFAVAIINGMISTTGTYSPNGLNSTGGLGKVFRLTATPMTGLTLGASYAFGPFMKDQYADSTSALYDEHSGDYPQHIVAGDIDFSIGHLWLYGIAAYNTWNYIGGQKLNALCYSAEGRYAVTPRVYVAMRAGGLQFGSISGLVTSYNFRSAPYSGNWDKDVFRLEGAVGYRIERDLLVKVCYQVNRTYGVPIDPADNVLAVQTVLSY